MLAGLRALSLNELREYKELLLIDLKHLQRKTRQIDKVIVEKLKELDSLYDSYQT